uniref:Uncharacterized protein n=1 Tax=Triticum urartu TaxID=4572 RepID=A0A8R7Q0E6_TRIUA
MRMTGLSGLKVPAIDLTSTARQSLIKACPPVRSIIHSEFKDQQKLTAMAANHTTAESAIQSLQNPPVLVCAAMQSSGKNCRVADSNREDQSWTETEFAAATAQPDRRPISKTRRIIARARNEFRATEAGTGAGPAGINP